MLAEVVSMDTLVREETWNLTETHVPEAGGQGTGQEGGSLFQSVGFTEGQTAKESAQNYVYYRFHLLPRMWNLKCIHFNFNCEGTLSCLLPVLKIDVNFTLEFLIL